MLIYLLRKNAGPARGRYCLTLKNMEHYLGGHCIRIHKSYLVIKRAIQFVEGNQVKINDELLPIGLKYREDFFRHFKGL